MILFFLAEKEGSYLPIFLNMFAIPLGIIYNTSRHNVSGVEYAVYAMFVVYMMANLESKPVAIKFFGVLTTTCAVTVAGLDLYDKYAHHLLKFKL